MFFYTTKHFELKNNMTYTQALIKFAFALMSTSKYPYDSEIVEKVAIAVSEVTENYVEAETLIKIARYESGGFREDVANCKVRGDHGKAHGLFQVHPWTKEEQKMLCSDDFTKQASVALERVRESFRMCSRAGLKGSDKLTAYTRGHCSKDGKAARLRYGSGKTIQKYMKEKENE